MKILCFTLLIAFSYQAQAAFFCYYLVKGDTITASYDPPYDLTYPPIAPLSLNEIKGRESMGYLIVGIDDGQCDGKTVMVDEH